MLNKLTQAESTATIAYKEVAWWEKQRLMLCGTRNVVEQGE